MLDTSATLAAVGGYLDAFTYIGHGRVFANAMSGNVVLLAADAMSRSWLLSLRHLLPILMFLLGIASARGMAHPRFGRWFKSPELAVLAIEIVIFFGLGWLPLNTSDFLMTMTIAFVASLQTETFRNINGKAYSSTFTTGNLRTMIENACDWLWNGRQAVHLHAARDFAGICSMFFVGAVLGALATPRMHNRAIWVDVAMMVLVFLWLLRGTRAEAAMP